MNRIPFVSSVFFVVNGSEMDLGGTTKDTKSTKGEKHLPLPSIFSPGMNNHARQDALEQSTSVHRPVIHSFANKPTEKLWLGQRPPELPPSLLKVALRKLTQLEAASHLDVLRLPPGNRLEELKGDRKGQHSIRINDQYRVCFNWDGQNADAVEITDYH